MMDKSNAWIVTLRSGARLTDKDVAKIVRRLFQYVKENKEIEILKHDKYNISFIHKDATSMELAFTLESEFSEPDKLTVLKRIAEEKIDGTVVLKSGEWGGIILAPLEPTQKKMYSKIVKIMEKAVPDKIKVEKFKF